VIVQLIGATTTETGLKVGGEIDGNLYPKGIKVTEREMQTINIARAEFHGEWTYTVSPRTFERTRVMVYSRLGPRLDGVDAGGHREQDAEANLGDAQRVRQSLNQVEPMALEMSSDTDQPGFEGLKARQLSGVVLTQLCLQLAC
jgi:hypothetical protein